MSGDGELALRGYIVGGENGLGSGTLSVIRDDGEGIPFAGTISLVSDSAEENFSRYFAESEQLPTGVALDTALTERGVRAGGVFLQPLPNASEKTRRRIGEETAACRELLCRGELEKIFARFDAQPLQTLKPKFKCRCSLKKVQALLFAMGREGALEACREEGILKVHCDYCNADYAFDEAQLKKIFSGNRYEQ